MVRPYGVDTLIFFQRCKNCENRSTLEKFTTDYAMSYFYVLRYSVFGLTLMS